MLDCPNAIVEALVGIDAAVTVEDEPKVRVAADEAGVEGAAPEPKVDAAIAFVVEAIAEDATALNADPKAEAED